MLSENKNQREVFTHSISPQSVPGTGDDDKKEGSEMTMAEKKEAERLRCEYERVKWWEGQMMGG